MSWRYVLPRERPQPPCPACKGLSGVVRLRGDIYVCMDCVPRRAFEAVWVADAESLPISADDLTDDARALLNARLVGVGKTHRVGYERGYVDGLIDAPRLGASFKERNP